MQLKTSQPSGSYLNVMEELVKNEIEKQTQMLPAGLRSYINDVEVATYALNRLPAFYASSQQGRERQLIEAYQYKDKITQEVRRALAAVRRDPLRSSRPLINDRDRKLQQADAARREIVRFLSERHLVGRKDINWENLASVILQSFNELKSSNSIHKLQPKAWQEDKSGPNSSSAIVIKIPYRKG